MVPQLVGRRTLLHTLALAPGLLAGAGRALAEAPAETPIAYLAANSAGGTDFRLAALDAQGQLLREWSLPARGHGMTALPPTRDGRQQAVIFARRPGHYALIVNLNDGTIATRIDAVPGRHFEGHGIVSPDGTRLYATESAHDDGRGLLGIYDLTQNARRIGEMPTYGIGPHAVLALAGWTALVVANGGILTMPATGREKLNLADMQPSLAIIDPRDGTLLSLRAPPAELSQLSIRHIAIAPDGGVAIALQYEGPAEDTVPLVAIAEPDGSPLRFLDTPETVRMRLQQYCGDVAMDQAGQRFAVSGPRGGLITLWRRDGSFEGSVALADGCGLSPAKGEARGIVATSGYGDMLHLPDKAKLAHTPRAWDNHLIPV
jgi:uncharacterized protein